jgi:hypothetical protein
VPPQIKTNKTRNEINRANYLRNAEERKRKRMERYWAAKLLEIDQQMDWHELPPVPESTGCGSWSVERSYLSPLELLIRAEAEELGLVEV